MRSPSGESRVSIIAASARSVRCPPREKGFGCGGSGVYFFDPWLTSFKIANRNREVCCSRPARVRTPLPPIFATSRSIDLAAILNASRRTSGGQPAGPLASTHVLLPTYQSRSFLNISNSVRTQPRVTTRPDRQGA